MLETIKMLWFFINPINIILKGWIGIIDIMTFIVVPYLFFKKIYKDVWWRVIFFYVGFILTQIVIRYQPMLEYVFELAGILLMLFACLGKHKEVKK